MDSLRCIWLLTKVKDGFFSLHFFKRKKNYLKWNCPYNCSSKSLKFIQVKNRWLMFWFEKEQTSMQEMEMEVLQSIRPLSTVYWKPWRLKGILKHCTNFQFLSLGQNQIVENLIRNGADINARRKDLLTPLHLATFRGLFKRFCWKFAFLLILFYSNEFKFSIQAKKKWLKS